MLFRAAGKTLDDPQWVDMGNPTGDSTSFNTQPTYVVRYTPKNASVEPYFLYMADNWVHADSAGLIGAGYVWLPFNFHADGVTVSLEKKLQWNIDNPWQPAPAPVSCDNELPGEGARVRLRTCNPSAVSQHFDLGTRISLRSNHSLSFKGAAAGTGGIFLASGAGDPIAYNPATRNIKRTDNNQCLDVTFCGNTPCEGTFLEYYACNEVHQNQEFDYNETSGLVKSHLTDSSGAALCIAACSGSASV
eukprot:INCI8232.4.p1 GENE.INCI8232.4~~INCI8232.4.p1  ORF type:complete len:247 (+),score=28.68 INCI8232.4:84-824(+)